MGYFDARRATKLSETQKDLLAYLGTPYKELVIDLEPCLYRDFGDFDIEISGGHDRRKKGDFSLYIRDKRDGLHIIELHIDMGWDFSEIKAVLDQIAERYAIGENIPPWEASL